MNKALRPNQIGKRLRIDVGDAMFIAQDFHRRRQPRQPQRSFQLRVTALD